MIEQVRGTRDIVDMRLFSFTISTIIKQLHIHNYQEIITPLIEPLELFKRSLGVSTDVVGKEMFIVSSSSADKEESLCLRPEATASVVRAFVNNGISQVPWKVFTWGPMFRYERPQKGRYRQFYQVSIECIGSDSMAQDASFIAMLDRLFTKDFGFETYALHINFLGTREERALFTKEMTTFLQKHTSEICETCVTRSTKNILRVFDCKEQACQKVYAQAPQLENSFGQQSKQEWQQLRNYLEELSVSFIINPRLVRGLDYYNKTVFEFISPDLGAQATFCGGGRYDYLVSHIGGKEDQPSIGAAIGIDRVLLLLEPLIDSLPLQQQKPLQVIIPLSGDQHGLALQIADVLTTAGVTVDVLFEGSVKNMFKKANKLGAQHCIIIGSQEQESGSVVVKNMQQGTEQLVKQRELVSLLK